MVASPRLLAAQPVQITSNRRLHQAAVLFSQSRHRPGLSRTSSECQRVRITITQAMAKQMPAQRVATGETLKPCSSQNFSVDQQYYCSRNKQFPWESWKIAFPVCHVPTAFWARVFSSLGSYSEQNAADKEEEEEVTSQSFYTQRRFWLNPWLERIVVE